MQRLGAGEVHEGLVDREHFDQRRELQHQTSIPGESGTRTAIRVTNNPRKPTKHIKPDAHGGFFSNLIGGIVEPSMGNRIGAPTGGLVNDGHSGLPSEP